VSVTDRGFYRLNSPQCFSLQYLCPLRGQFLAPFREGRPQVRHSTLEMVEVGQQGVQLIAWREMPGLSCWPSVVGPPADLPVELPENAGPPEERGRPEYPGKKR